MAAGFTRRESTVMKGFGTVLFLLCGLPWLSVPSLPAIETISPVNHAADLSVTITAAPNPVALGSNVAFSLTVSNAGPADATNVSMSDSLPYGLMLVSVAADQGVCKSEGPFGSDITCDLGSIPAGSRVGASIVAQPFTKGPFPNTASISGSECDPNLDDNTASAVVRIESKLTYSLTADVNKDGKIDVLDFHLISVPVLNPDDDDPLAVFGPGMARYNPGKIGIYQCISGSGNYRDYKKGISPVAPGQGYWVITAKDRNLEISGEEIPPCRPYAVTLHPGWNIVGFPFLRPLGVCNVRVQAGENLSYPLDDNPWVQNQAWGYNKGYFPVIGTSGDTEHYLFRPWNAYWMYNTGDQEVQVVFYPFLRAVLNTPVTRQALTASALKSGISFTVKEAGKKYQDATLFLGVDPSASAGPDALDCLSPPPVSSDVPRLYVDHGNWPDRPGKYARDFRPSGQGPVTFKVTLEVPDKDVAATYVLKWDIGSLDSGTKAKLVGASPAPINMRRAASCAVTVPARTTKYRLTVKLMD